MDMTTLRPGASDAEGALARAIADHDDICSRMAIPECSPAILAALSADGWRVEREEDVWDALTGLLIAVDNAALSALVDVEDGAEEPEWQTRLWDAADEARTVRDRVQDAALRGGPDATD